jgi:hypothetical protein
VLGLAGGEHEAMLESVWCVEDEQDPNLGPGRLADFDHVVDRRLWREGDRSSRPRAELDVGEWAA